MAAIVMADDGIAFDGDSLRAARSAARRRRSFHLQKLSPPAATMSPSIIAAVRR